MAPKRTGLNLGVISAWHRVWRIMATAYSLLNFNAAGIGIDTNNNVHRWLISEPLIFANIAGDIYRIVTAGPYPQRCFGQIRVPFSQFKDTAMDPGSWKPSSQTFYANFQLERNVWVAISVDNYVIEDGVPENYVIYFSGWVQKGQEVEVQ